MVEGNKAWWEFPKWTHEYEKGADDYIEKAFAIKSQGNQIRCPCIVCHFRYWQHRNVVRDHLICNGFIPKEDDLSQLGVKNQRDYVFESGETSNMNDGIEELLANTMREGPNEDAKKFLHLVEEGQQELYPGCKNFSRLSFIIRLFTYKCDYKLTNVAFSALLEILREVLPEEAKLPKSFYEANKVIKLLGLDYQKIDACPNDCMLYWEEFADATSCHVCGSPRWESKDEDNNGKNHKIPKKILRYFPIKKRLQRLYMCSKTAKYMTWHANRRNDDELLQHPVDGKSKDFDKAYPIFAENPRNVRLGLATDGFNPFYSMSIVHSTWPVFLEQSKKNKKNRELAHDMHTMGPRSYAILRHKLQEEDPEKQEPSQAKVYIASRRRDPKKKYKTNSLKIKGNIDKMETLASQARDDGSSSKDPYYEVITKADHSGRVPLFGHGVTKTDLKKKGKNSGYILLKDFMQRIEAEAIQKLQEANPGVNLMIPESLDFPISSNASNTNHQIGNLNGGNSSISTHSPNQVQSGANASQRSDGEA